MYFCVTCGRFCSYHLWSNLRTCFQLRVNLYVLLFFLIGAILIFLLVSHLHTDLGYLRDTFERPCMPWSWHGIVLKISRAEKIWIWTPSWMGHRVVPGLWLTSKMFAKPDGESPHNLFIVFLLLLTTSPLLSLSFFLSLLPPFFGIFLVSNWTKSSLLSSPAQMRPQETRS